MEFKEFSAKTVEDAITDATIEFGVTSDRLEYNVVTEGSAGLFGMFSKQAVIKARIKEEQPEIKPEIKPEVKAEIKKSEPKAEVKPAPKTFVKKEEVKKEIKEAPKAEEKPQVKAESKAESKPATAAVKESKKSTDSSEVKVILSAFLGDVLEKMDAPCEVQVDINDEERTIDINLEGNTGDIIGKRGQTLDALQYLASIVANKEKENYYRLKLDTKNYRERRAKTLENLARNVAAKVKKTRRKIVLEPMNPYERRIIHAYLQSDSQVTTKSEGEEPNRRVVVYYKR